MDLYSQLVATLWIGHKSVNIALGPWTRTSCFSVTVGLCDHSFSSEKLWAVEGDLRRRGGSKVSLTIAFNRNFSEVILKTQKKLASC